ncbi:MAG TPA: trigger factor [Gemmatimonadaceae bacterium]|nr:trigger factor [Gemmatimonadaceae bacterium]
MNVTIESSKSEGVERHIRVSVPADEVAAATARVVNRYSSAVRLPGFRKGKAPPPMVRKKFANEIRQETLESLLREAYDAVVERENLKLVAQPHAHDVSFDEGKPLTFELHCEVRPDVTLDRVHGFSVVRPKAEVTDAAVREQIDALRDQRAAWTPVEERAIEGDLVTARLASADAEGVIGAPNEYKIEIGRGQAIPAIEEVIMSCAPGETIERAVKWPDDFPDPEQAGKTKTVRVTVREVKRKSLPPLDDAFARELGDFDSVDALNKAVREDLTSTATREADSAVRQRLLDEVLAANPFPVPPTWVNRLLAAYAEMYKVPPEEHERFAKELGPTAERQVRRDVVLETLAEREKLTATEADVDAKVSELASKRGIEPGQLYASLQKAGRLKELERGITEDRVFAWLFERNTVVPEE